MFVAPHGPYDFRFSRFSCRSLTVVAPIGAATVGGGLPRATNHAVTALTSPRGLNRGAPARRCTERVHVGRHHDFRGEQQRGIVWCGTRPREGQVDGERARRAPACWSLGPPRAGPGPVGAPSGGGGAPPRGRPPASRTAGAGNSA